MTVSRAPEVAIQEATGAGDAPLHGRWLIVARIGWMALAIIIVTLNALAAPAAGRSLLNDCYTSAQCVGLQLTAYDLRLLAQLGMSTRLFALYSLCWDILSLLVYTAMAALIFWRRSTDRMALFCAYMLLLTGGGTYTDLLQEGLRSLSPWWYWPVQALTFAGLMSLLTFFLIFPRGSFTPRWTRLWLIPFVLAEGHYVFFTDPLKVSQSGPFDLMSLAAIIVGLVVLQVYRYRYVLTYREREQTKWVIFGFAFALGGFVVATIAVHFVLPEAIAQSTVVNVLLTGTLSYAFFLLIPISIAIAVLRTRLYDIDIIINRALVYGALTGSLGALYAGMILAMASLATAVTGRATSQPLALVISTLVIVALVRPWRRRIQSVIDRRFYRRKYDAEKTLVRFTATLRSEVDLEQIREQLVTIVEETMQPAHASLWLNRAKRRLV